MTKNRPVVVAVSGGFDPLHVGHLRMIREAAALGDRLVVILNNDVWLRRKKGHVFMPQEERREILLGLRYVDDVLVSTHADEPTGDPSVDALHMSVVRELLILEPSIFANGGDRDEAIPEYAVCQDLGIEMRFGVGGGKVQSSSELVAAAVRTEVTQ